jgi:predicted TIM-barrel fold metal-dependent hydrolase
MLGTLLTAVKQEHNFGEVDDIDLTGTVAIVTGSGRGLGLAYAKALASAGAAVVVDDVDGAAVSEAVGETRGAGGRATGVPAAVGDEGKSVAFADGGWSAEPGGGGIRLCYSNPMLIDDVAVDFPELRIILAHPSFPWQDEAPPVATHKPHVHIDLSGWPPKYFPPS